MRYLKKFFEHINQSNPTIWEIDWHQIAPQELVVIKGDTTDNRGIIKGTDILMKYKLGNIMADPVHQVTYDRDFDYSSIKDPNKYPSIPDTLEFDIFLAKKDETLTREEGEWCMSIDITFGDLTVSGFKICPPNEIDKPYIYTSYHSKMDPSNTVFAFDESSLQSLVQFINKFDGFEIKREDLNFLDVQDNFDPNQ
jgi:hypothetical protein